jgi:hypothetical protein
MHPVVSRILGRFLTKKEMRYIERNPGKVSDSIQSYAVLLSVIGLALLISFLFYGLYTFFILFNLALVLGIFYLHYNSVFNSEDAKNRPEAYDHVAGIGFALNSGCLFIIIFIFVLIFSVSYVHTAVFG